MNMTSGCAIERSRNRGCRRSRWNVGLVSALFALLLAVPVQAQQTRVSGTVTSAENGNPLPGANVTVKGTPINTITNSRGGFSILVPAPNDTLLFSLIGFAERQVPLEGRTTVSVVLDVSAVGLEGIVVTGYGTQQRRDITGSVASIKGSDLTELPTANVVQALQGKVAGVQVSPVSGEPGADAVVRIRGVGTLNDASPLFVVDGMMTDDLQFLSPTDVASVEVLKDASATAIYGSRGANGVIIITTKKGMEGSRGTTYQFGASGGTQGVLNKIDLVNAQQYAMLVNELRENANQAPLFPDGYDGPSTDWQDEVFQNAPIQNYQFSASGGMDRITYYFSANYLDQEGVIPHSTYKRLTIRLNNEYQLSDNVSFGHNLSFSDTEDQRPPSILDNLYMSEPTVRPRDEDGTFNPIDLAVGGNPVAGIFYTNNEGGAQRLVGNLYGELVFLDNFSFRSSFGLDNTRSEFRSFVPVYYVDPQQQNEISDLSVSFGHTDGWLWENTLTWNYLNEAHRMTLLGGTTAQSFERETFGGSRDNVPGARRSLWYLDAASLEGVTNSNSSYHWKMLSYLFRANYTFLDRYLFTGSLRVDGSSRFGEESRYGWFPSFALGWDLAQEGFMDGVEAVSALKLRGSWGVIGNDKIGPYPAVPLVTGNLNYPLGESPDLRYGASPIALANPAIRWEETEQYNIGADIALFNGRVETSLEYYNRTTDGILVQVPIPDYVGAAEPIVNAAKVRNKGFEGIATWFGNLGPLVLELSANGATVDNEVLELGEGREEIFGGAVSGMSNTTRTVVGEPVGAYWGYVIEGVYQTQEEIDNAPTDPGVVPGDLRYKDINNDGQINSDDQVTIGSPIPDFIYGFDANVRVGAFDFGVGFAGQAGNDVLNAKKARRFGAENFETTYLDRWTGPGTSNWEPRVTSSGHNYQASERWLEDGSFLKLHTAQLGFRLPQDLTAKLGVDIARLYVNGANLALWTDYTGYTPELTGSSVINSGLDQLSGTYPPARIIKVGVDLTF